MRISSSPDDALRAGQEHDCQTEDALSLAMFGVFP